MVRLVESYWSKLMRENVLLSSSIFVKRCSFFHQIQGVLFERAVIPRLTNRITWCEPSAWNSRFHHIIINIALVDTDYFAVYRSLRHVAEESSASCPRWRLKIVWRTSEGKIDGIDFAPVKGTIYVYCVCSMKSTLFFFVCSLRTVSWITALSVNASKIRDDVAWRQQRRVASNALAPHRLTSQSCQTNEQRRVWRRSPIDTWYRSGVMSIDWTLCQSECFCVIYVIWSLWPSRQVS